jgi:hypothetical protein
MNTSLDSSLATLHQADNKVIPVVSIAVAGLRIRTFLQYGTQCNKESTCE